MPPYEEETGKTGKNASFDPTLLSFSFPIELCKAIEAKLR
jgi:hypothetical protein